MVNPTIFQRFHMCIVGRTVFPSPTCATKRHDQGSAPRFVALRLVPSSVSPSIERRATNRSDLLRRRRDFSPWNYKLASANQPSTSTSTLESRRNSTLERAAARFLPCRDKLLGDRETLEDADRVLMQRKKRGGGRRKCGFTCSRKLGRRWIHCSNVDCET